MNGLIKQEKHYEVKIKQEKRKKLILEKTNFEMSKCQI